MNSTFIRLVPLAFVARRVTAHHMLTLASGTGGRRVSQWSLCENRESRT
jgi:hypothetical protein